MKGLGIKIEIEEIENGFTVDFFTLSGIPDLDGKVYAPNIEVAMRNVQEWLRRVQENQKGVRNLGKGRNP